MNRVREWLIRKLGGHPYLPAVPVTKLQIEQIPMEAKKVYAKLEYLVDHKPPDDYLEKTVTVELAMRLRKEGLINFDYQKAEFDPEHNPHGDKRRILASIRVLKQQEAN